MKLLWRRQAGQLGHKLQTGDDGHKPPMPIHPPYTSGVSIITPKVNIPSSFDVQLGRVSFVEKDAGANVLFCMLALPMQGRATATQSVGGLLHQVCGFGGAIANLQMCLPLLSGELIKCSGYLRQ